MIQETGFLLANRYLSWLPAFSNEGWIGIAVACTAAWLVIRFFWGKSLYAPKAGLWALRLGALAICAIILCGPTIIDEQAGTVTRPTMFYLYDGSQSMQLGKQSTRWQESLEFVSDAQGQVGEEHTTHTQSFRFGHRLKPLRTEATGSDQAANNSTKANEPTISLVSTGGANNGDDANSNISPPSASDTRLGDAMRQLLPQINAKSSAGVVLLSDGRVRASETVERLAEVFGEQGVPVNVVPIGEASGTGDIAVVSLVVPDRVRKYTENELQVFIRSFGFTGQRTIVRVVSKNRIGGDQTATLASRPITLTGGAQSIPLTFRVNEHPEDLEVIVDPIEGELTDRNNRVTTHVDIDRTKVRVLYVSGDQNSRTSSNIFSNLLFGGGQTTTPSPSIDSVRDALMGDEDIECSVLVSVNGSAPRGDGSGSSSTISSFPRTRAELFAYDCVVLNDVGPNVLDEQQVQWLTNWIQGRGGGLIVTGGKALKLSNWRDIPLEELLPVSLANAQLGQQQTDIQIAAANHAIWRLRLDESLNEELLGQIPQLTLGGTGFGAKPTAQVLANDSEGNACMVAHRAGRGRIFVSTAALGGSNFRNLTNNWGTQPERVAAKLWRNMVYWATEGSSTGRRRLITRADKRFYRPGERLKVMATAFDEVARQTKKYRVWAMFEPASLEDMTLYSPIMWPDNVRRESGEVGPRIAWGEELQLTQDPNGEGYMLDLTLSETITGGDGGFRIELTAYEGEDSESAFDHGTQVDSASLSIQVLSDPFEQQNPLPNHELLHRIADISGGKVLRSPDELARLLEERRKTEGPRKRDSTPAWNRWWLWLGLLGLVSTEWVWRRVTGLA